MIDAAKLVQEEIKRALAPPPGFTVHNATDEWIEITYDAETMRIPPVDVVVPPHPEFDHVPCSARDADGDWIPGTLVISNKDGDRGTPFNVKGSWLAAHAIKHCLGIDVTTGVADGPYYKRGLTVIPSSPTKEVLSQIVADGSARYATWRVHWAKETVEAYNDRAAKHRSLNLQPQAPPIDYDIALEVLKRDSDKRRAEVMARMGKPIETVETTKAKDDIFQELLNNPDMLKALLGKMKEAAKAGE